MPFKNKCVYLDKYIPRIDSWAICDIFCAKLKIKEKEEIWQYISQYLNTPKEFEVRFSLVTRLDHFLIEEKLKEIIRIIEQIKTNHYYV